jgi:hypothetical protein
MVARPSGAVSTALCHACICCSGSRRARGRAWDSVAGVTNWLLFGDCQLVTIGPPGALQRPAADRIPGKLASQDLDARDDDAGSRRWITGAGGRSQFRGLLVARICGQDLQDRPCSGRRRTRSPGKTVGQDLDAQGGDAGSGRGITRAG